MDYVETFIGILNQIHKELIKWAKEEIFNLREELKVEEDRNNGYCTPGFSSKHYIAYVMPMV
jgi:hypothetical protein